jgi:hypothetical protein
MGLPSVPSFDEPFDLKSHRWQRTEGAHIGNGLLLGGLDCGSPLPFCGLRQHGKL